MNSKKRLATAFTITLMTFTVGSSVYLSSRTTSALVTTEVPVVYTYCNNMKKRAGSITVQTLNGERYVTFKKLTDCKEYHDKRFEDALVTFSAINKAVYGLELEGFQIVSVQKSIDSGRMSTGLVILFLCLLVWGVYKNIIAGWSDK